MRLFYGLSLPDNVRRCASDHAQILSSQFPGRYVLPENYHITLAFLGDVPEDRAADACDILRQYTINMPSPLLTLGETGFFGNRERAIVTIRIQDTPPLLPLHQSLVHALDNAGLPADHGPFSPHITLARKVFLPPPPLPHCQAVSFRAPHAHLYLSARNTENVLTYTPIFTTPFKV